MKQILDKSGVKILHKHHIIPKHAGGTDMASNLIELTVEEHAEAHRVLFEQHGRWQDKLAWQTLSGQITHAEAILIAQKNADKTWMKTPEGKDLLKAGRKKMKARGFKPWNTGLTKADSPSLQKSSERNLLHRSQGRLANIGEIMKGTTFTSGHRTALSEAAKQRDKQTCPYCGKSVIPQMFIRWHGDNCRLR